MLLRVARWGTRNELGKGTGNEHSLDAWATDQCMATKLNELELKLVPDTYECNDGALSFGH